MEDQKITAFDTLFTSNHIQILKLALPLLPAEKQYFGAVFIKYMELNYTLNLIRHLNDNIYSSEMAKNYNIETFLQEIIPYCGVKEREQIKKMHGMLNSFKSFQEIKSMMDLMNGVNGDGSGDGGDSGFSMDLLKGMLSEEQRSMFDMFMAGGE